MLDMHLVAARLVAAVLFLSTVAFAQTERGTVRGTVIDTTGASIGDGDRDGHQPSDRSCVRNRLNRRRRLPSPSDSAGNLHGRGRVQWLQRSLLRENVRIAAGAIVPLDLVMEIGDVTESVTVSAAAITLKTESTEVSTEVNPKSFVELPLQVVGGSGRAVESFIFLAPGTSGNTFDAHINGSQTLTKEIQMDGMSMTTAEVGGDPRVILLPPEAVQEFSLLTNNYSSRVQQ